MLAQEMCGYDGAPIYAYASVAAWEFGGGIETPAKKYAGARVVTPTPVQNQDDAYTLQVPEDVTKAGAMPFMLEFARMQADHGMPVGVFPAAGSFGLAGPIVGQGRLLKWTIKKPELVDVVLEKGMTFTLRVLHYTDQVGNRAIMPTGLSLELDVLG